MVRASHSDSFTEETFDLPVPWDGEEDDCESHPSLESDAEAELLDLFDDEDENESGCYVESPLSTSPSADGSFEPYDATVVQNRKLALLNRQQRQQQQQRTAFRETNSFCTNHANLLSPNLTIPRVERTLKKNQRKASKERVRLLAVAFFIPIFEYYDCHGDVCDSLGDGRLQTSRPDCI